VTQPPINPVPYQPAPPLPAADRVRTAYYRRHESDYIFDFWSAFGWILLTCGIYLVYVVYQLVRRSRDHNLRRLELLDAANAVAWERAVAQGREEELRPHFERVATHLDAMRRRSHEFRDPVVWMILALFVRFVVELIVFVLLDGDLVHHDYDEGGAENELAFIFGQLGTPMPAPDPARLHQAQNYAARIIVSIVTFGIYTLVWLYNVMDDGNRHFTANWAWEDSLAQALQGGT
jgi:Domain of unknown function (DUF4234)